MDMHYFSFVYRFMKTAAQIACFLTVLSLAGCMTWTKPGATDQDRHAAIARCQAMAYQRLPPVMQTVQIAPAEVTPAQMHCSERRHGQSCTMTGGTYIPPDYINQDVNQPGRDSIVKDCMYQQGWILK